MLQALISWLQSEWEFSHVIFLAQKPEERQIRLFEEADLRLLYVMKPARDFLDEALAYLLD